ncbi:MAG: ATP-binding protein [Lachnospiraceae bacterium]|nr:ATP-binding protein [Lachnospiraceae bacterium]
MDQISAGIRNGLLPANTNDEIYFNFSYAALKLLGKNLYNNPASAISELVANSFDARAENIYVYIDMTDKERSIIEIIDDGEGMDYDELQRKYVWVGRNKREDNTEQIKNDSYAVMGRKGIGKLAAFYLSDHYSIYTKKSGHTGQEAWRVDMSAYKDSDFPRMDRIKDDFSIDNYEIWRNHDHGTLLRLDKVDLTGTGEKKIESLQRLFADYYLTDMLDAEIRICVKTSREQEIEYAKVQKRIAFGNMYAIFDNTDRGYYKKLNKEIQFKWASPYEDIANKGRSTVKLDEKKFETSGNRSFSKENGDLIEKRYKLKGWIGIHATIDQQNAIDKKYIRNKIYNPNCLRLYVRDKLAVANYFDIHVNTQAMSNYIEGEISFDILDDDELPDIATSSRQNFLEDERVSLLFEIVDKIVGSLMSARNTVGNEIRQENEQRKKEEEEKIEKKRRAEQEARRRAEEEKKRAEREKEEAEEKSRTAEKKQKEAENERNKAQERQKAAEQDARRERRRSNYIMSVSKLENGSVLNSVHSIYNQSKRVKENLDKIVSSHEYTGVLQKNLLKAEESNQFALIASKNISKAGKTIEDNDASTTVDVVSYVFQYMEQVMRAIYDSNEIDIIIKPSEAYLEREIRQLSLAIVLDNIVGNAIKAHATKIEVEAIQTSRGVDILFVDDGNGLSPDIDDINRIYDFGYTTTNGSGLGLYYSKKYLNIISGDIVLSNNKNKGVTVRVSIREK